MGDLESNWRRVESTFCEENRCCRRAQEKGANRGKRERLGGGIDKQAAPKGYKYKEEGEGEKRRRRKNIEAD